MRNLVRWPRRQGIRILNLRSVIAAFALCVLIQSPLWAENISSTSPFPKIHQQVWDVAAARWIPLDALSYRLSSARWVLLGEQHDNPSHHQLQARFLSAMLAAGRHPALAVEMITPDQADGLRTVYGPSGHPRLRRPLKEWNQALAWERRGWPAWSWYRPIFAAASAARLPILPANVTRDRIKSTARGADPDIPAAVRQTQTTAVVEGHCGLIKADQAGPMVRVQVERDRVMAQAMLDGDHQTRDGAVLIAGAGHTRTDAGVPWHLQKLGVARSAILSIAITESPTGETPWGDTPPRPPAQTDAPYDYLVFTDPAVRPDLCASLRARFSHSPGAKPEAPSQPAPPTSPQKRP